MARLALLVAMVSAAAAQNGSALGVNTAPITLELYSDYQCPACKTLFNDVIKPLIADYVTSGKVYLIHREFPLQMHAHARPAARYAVAAGRIGKYEQVAEALFAAQSQWEKNGDVDAAVAKTLSRPELEKVRKLVKDAATEQVILNDVNRGTQSGLRQTPTMIFTHRLRTYPVAGLVSYPIVKRFLDSLLAK